MPRPIYYVHFVRDFLPLSLGMIAAYARTRLSKKYFDLTVRFVNCKDELESYVQTSGPGVFLFSNYLWNIDSHLAASQWVKASSPQSVTLHGGPSIPAYPDACRQFLLHHRHVDYCARGEGEITTVELLEHIALYDSPPVEVPGLGFLTGDDFIQTPPRTRSTNLDEFPSPYLTGVFDEIYSRAIYAILETNRGCPYGCTFCDWGSATLQNVRRFSIERVAAEIRWMSEHGIRDINIADANFGITSRDLEICRMLCSAKQKTGYPKRVLLNYAKNTHKHVVEIVELMANEGLITSGTISIQSRDAETLKAIRRQNIKTEEYEKLQKVFSARELPLDAQLMLGLPGSTLDSFKSDLRYYFFTDINVRVFRTVLLPNSPMAEPAYRARYQIETDPSGTIVATSTLTQEQLQQSDCLARLFRCAHGYGMLRYLLWYLFGDHGIDPIEYLERLLLDMNSRTELRDLNLSLLEDFCRPDPENEVIIRQLLGSSKDVDPSNRAASSVHMIPATHIRFREALRTTGGWGKFYREIRSYTAARYSIPESSSTLNTALVVQEALMPHLGRVYPFSAPLQHDFVGYYRKCDARGDRNRPLADYGPGWLKVSDPLSLAETGTYRQNWTLTDFWQLHSPLGGAGRSTMGRIVDKLRKEDLNLGPISCASSVWPDQKGLSC